jgi:hypothetical protein
MPILNFWLIERSIFERSKQMEITSTNPVEEGPPQLDPEMAVERVLHKRFLDRAYGYQEGIQLRKLFEPSRGRKALQSHRAQKAEIK